MTRKNMILVRGKYRYGNPTEQETKKWDASASRLDRMIKLSGISGKKICILAEQKEKTIYESNLTDYRKGRRGIKTEHLEIISSILWETLKNKGYDYNEDYFRQFLSGMELTCDTYEEFVAMATKKPEFNFQKYRNLLKQAGFILLYDDGFYSITDKDEKQIDCGYDVPEYSILYDGISKHFSPEEMEGFYQQIIRYMQDAFINMKEGDAND